MESAILSFIGVLVACLINNWFVSRKISADLLSQSSKTYKELITAERIKWLNTLRESMAEYLSKSYYVLSFKSATAHLTTKTRFIDSPITQELSQLSFLIKLRLNPNQGDHQGLVKKLDRLDGMLIEFLNDMNIPERAFDDYEEEIHQFSKACQNVLKSEWELVKREANPDKIIK